MRLGTAPFRIRRRDVSRMNCRTCRSSSRVARRLLRHAQRLDLDAFGVRLARQLLGEPLDVALRKRREGAEARADDAAVSVVERGEIVAQEIVDRRRRLACRGRCAPSPRPARRTAGRGSSPSRCRPRVRCGGCRRARDRCDTARARPCRASRSTARRRGRSAPCASGRATDRRSAAARTRSCTSPARVPIVTAGDLVTNHSERRVSCCVVRSRQK